MKVEIDNDLLKEFVYGTAFVYINITRNLYIMTSNNIFS